MANSTNAFGPLTSGLAFHSAGAFTNRASIHLSEPGLPAPKLKMRAQRRMHLTHDQIIEKRVEKSNERAGREAELRALKQEEREQAAQRRQAAFDQREARRQHAPGSESGKRGIWDPDTPAGEDCNDRLRRVADKYGLIVDLVGVPEGMNGTSLCASEIPVIIDADRDKAVSTLLEAKANSSPVVVDQNSQTCREKFHPTSGTLFCETRGTIGLTTIDELIEELDPVLDRSKSAYVFMNRDESDGWLARMQERSPDQSHLPVIRLSSKDWLVSRLVLGIGIPAAASALLGFCAYLFCGWRCKAKDDGVEGERVVKMTLVLKRERQAGQAEAEDANDAGYAEASGQRQDEPVAMVQAVSAIDEDDDQELQPAPAGVGD